MKRPLMAAVIIAIFALSLFTYYHFSNAPTGFNLGLNFGLKGILTLYKNGHPVYEGPDLLTNDFYTFLVYALGNVAYLSGSSVITSSAYTTPPPNAACVVSISGTNIQPANPPQRFYLAGTGSPAVVITLGTNTNVSPTDCQLPIIAAVSATTAVYSALQQNYASAPAPCPTSPHGCVQITASYSATGPTTVSDAALYVAINFLPDGPFYTILAHDTFPAQTLAAGDTLQVVYTFIFPPAATQSGAWPATQGVFADMFGQAVSRNYYGIGDATNSARLFIDNVVVGFAGIKAYKAATTCSDSGPLGDLFASTKALTLVADPDSHVVSLYAPIDSPLNSLQVVYYTISTPGQSNIVLKASVLCSTATQINTVAGQQIGLRISA